MSKAGERRVNPELYARLTKPRPRAEVLAALEAFDAELYALREKHGIADLLVTSATHMEKDDGGSEVIITFSHYGNGGFALPMAGATFAHLRAEQDAETLAMAGLKTRRKKVDK